ncbi:hypothetical protein [Burkholderia sp. Nafp2/4-1b]|uniref:hypothetical protein n=1 Tax=Burkholderia sp. Nafp2/4-1b TaxID=2116686 RepID=UPI0013CE83A2|nr:hypothetical protein [Burkholderia sp. Nafp2/4-1b]
MSAELSGMVYDGPMTENQSVIEEIAMINCDDETLKFRLNWPLTVGPQGSARAPDGLLETNPDMHSFHFLSGSSIRSNTGKTFAHYPRFES